MFINFVLVFALFSVIFGFYDDQIIKSARIETCLGCFLLKYPEVKKFIELDIHEFEDVTFKEVPGALPEVVFFNKHDQELERHPFNCKLRAECIEILQRKGFRRSNFISETHIHNDI